MKKGFLRLLCMALCMVLALGCVGSAMADVFTEEYLASCEFVNEPPILYFGFGVPHPNNRSIWNVFYDNELQETYQDESKGLIIRINLYSMGDNFMVLLCEDPANQREYLEKLAIQDNILTTEYFDNDGHPVLIQVGSMDKVDFGIIWYIRNSAAIRMNVNSPLGTLTMNDMKLLAGMPICVADAELTVSAKGDPVVITAGKNIQFTSAFANPKKVNKQNKNDAVVWSVAKADTGEAVEGVSIDAKGQLKVDKSLSAPVDLQVKVASEPMGTSATYNISAMPVVSKVTLDPAELFFYVGTEDPQTVKAVLEPASVPPVGLTWTPAKKDIVEITSVEDGVVSIKPLKAGKTDIAVKEPGGKNAKLTVNVVAPVESVELKVNGKPKAGGKVNIAAALAPKNVGNKAVQWSLDVGEEIATINEKGQLTIGKEVTSGTKITVTCTALGAPNPVVGTIVVEVP